MGSAFGWSIAIFAVVWLFLAGRGIAGEIKRSQRTNWIMGLMGLLVLVGAGGFFAAGLSAVGVLKLPSSVEWPAGYATGVVTMSDGKYVVPLVPPGRVQLYDPQWHFLRGWHVDAEGGDFRVRCSPDGLIEVFTARGNHYYSFNEHGELISATTASDSEFSSLQNTGRSVVVPTPALLWFLSSPFLSWGVALVGMAGMALVRKLARSSSTLVERNNFEFPKMTVLIYPFLVLAFIGFVVVLSIHVSALAGSTALFAHFGKYLFPGLFVVWLPTILVMSRTTRDFKQKDIWKAALRGCPVWMRRTQYFIFGYSFFGAFVLPMLYGGGMNSASTSARAMSAIGVSFYSIATCVLYSATQVDKLDGNRRCANGHRVAPLAKYCDECGAPVVSASFHSAQNSL